MMNHNTYVHILHLKVNYMYLITTKTNAPSPSKSYVHFTKLSKLLESFPFLVSLFKVYLFKL